MEHGWLLRLHLSDCSRVTGSITRFDVHTGTCVVASPESLLSEREVALDEVCDVEVVSISLICAGRMRARLAVIPAWRGGSQDDSVLVADAFSGEISVGDAVVVTLPSGVRRMGTVTSLLGRRCRIALAGSWTGTPAQVRP